MVAQFLLALTLAAQPGVPETPPRADTDLWVTWANDWFGVPGAQTDDHRTNEFAVGLRKRGWVLMVDDSMLTLFDEADRERQHGARMDELTLTLGHEFHEVTIGVGAQYRGNAEGQVMQNWWHGLMNDPTVNATYESDGTVGLAYGLWRHSINPEPFFCPEVLASATATTDGEFAADGEARLVWYTQSNLTVWAGFRYQVRAGSFDTVSSEATASYERGLFYEFGFMLDQTFSFQSSYNVHERAAVGALTYMHKL